MPKIIVLEGDMKGQTFGLDGETVFIGRSSKNDIQIQDGAISRKQLKIFRIGKKFFVEDLKSTNGTMINGEQIPPGEGFEVDEGDSISIGSTVLQLTHFPPRKPLETGHLSNRKPETDRPPGPSSSERRSHSAGSLDLILKVSELLKGSWEIRELLDKTLDYIMETLPRIHRASVILFAKTERDGKEIKQVISRARNDAAPSGPAYSRTVVDRVLRDAKAIRMSNTSFEGVKDTGDHDDTLQIGSVLCVPLISNSEMLGVIYVDTIRQPYGFRKDDLLLLNALSGGVAVAIDKAMSG